MGEAAVDSLENRVGGAAAGVGLRSAALSAAIRYLEQSRPRIRLLAGRHVIRQGGAALAQRMAAARRGAAARRIRRGGGDGAEVLTPSYPLQSHRIG